MALTVIVVPHSHIDTEWYWTYDTTIEWSTEILQQALDRVTHDPDYTFSQDQVTIMAPVWDQLSEEERKAWQSAVAEGRWEPLLGMMTSPGLAEPSGESLIRQILHGQAWTEAHFGQAAPIAWLIDQFGQIPQLPQILTQAGYTGYVFSRDVPPDRDIADFPTDFWYRGPDGSRILTHWLAGHYSMGPGNLTERLHTLHQHSHQGLWMVPWGSDVVRPEMTASSIVTLVADAVHRIVPEAVVRLGTPRQYFDQLATQSDAIPTIDWDFNPPYRRGDLRGTWDTRVAFKIRHRHVEEALVATEALAATLGVETANDFTREWQLLLLSEFHDTMGGSCSDRVYERAMDRLAQVQEAVRHRQIQWLGALAATDTTPIFNPDVRARHDVVTLLPGDATSRWGAVDAGGHVLPSRQVAPGSPVECTLALSGLQVGSVHLVRSPRSAVTRRWLARGDHAEVIVNTAHYVGGFDPETGTLSWLRTHEGRPVWHPEDHANRLEVWHEDHPNLEGMLDLNDRRTWLQDPPDECWIEHNALGDIVSIGRPALGGRLRQTFRFYDHTPRIDCTVTLDGVVPPNGLLTVRVPRSRTTGTRIWYETPFALTERPEGHFAAHTFAVSGEREGLAILNRGTPGYWFEPDAGYLVLLRAFDTYEGYRRGATTSLAIRLFPGMERHPVEEFSGGKTGTVLAREVGTHRFDYALLPFAEGLPQAQVAEEAHAWNRPFVVGPTGGSRHTSPPPSSPPFLLDGLPVILDAFKPAEDGQGWIVRFHEPYGQAGPLTLTLLDSRFVQAGPVDVRERAVAPMVDGPQIALSVSPFQIQSWRLHEKKEHAQ
ncbi:MAG: glycosyl hydrolase-related protein [Thermaerobacter sp.]|nr:glycosyl hydrolase-related protein [Thermaerobacter sp.]